MDMQTHLDQVWLDLDHSATRNRKNPIKSDPKQYNFYLFFWIRCMELKIKIFVNLAYFGMNSELVNAQTNNFSQYNGQNLSDFEDFAR